MCTLHINSSVIKSISKIEQATKKFKLKGSTFLKIHLNTSSVSSADLQWIHKSKTYFYFLRFDKVGARSKIESNTILHLNNLEIYNFITDPDLTTIDSWEMEIKNDVDDSIIKSCLEFCHDTDKVQINFKEDFDIEEQKKGGRKTISNFQTIFPICQDY